MSTSGGTPSGPASRRPTPCDGSAISGRIDSEDTRLHDLWECLGDVGDPRDLAKVEHRLVDVLSIAVCAVLAQAERFEDIAPYGRS